MENLSLNYILAIIGLCMALVELYVPKLSLMLEESLDFLQKTTRSRYINVFNYLYSLKNKFINSKFRTTYMKHIRKGVSILFSIVILNVLLTELFGKDNMDIISLIISIPAAIVFIIGVFILLYVALFLLYYCISVSFYAVIFICERTIHSLNIIGKGKAISGIGILLAFYGVLAA